MADTKITALTALTAADPANDVIPIVDVSDTSMAASGTTKKISVNNILGASGTATLASATITGAATVGTTLGVTGQLSTADVLKTTGNPSLGVAGATEAFVAHNTGYGAILYGRGTTYDAALLDRNTGLRLTVTTSGAQVSGDLTVSTGNVVMATSGKGIDFSAVTGGTGTVTANVLNDYEEGTWTIGLTFGGGTTGLTTSSNAGRYTKVGRQVTVSGYLALSNKGSSVGAAVINGLPFTIGAPNAAYSAASLRLASISYTGAFQAFGAVNGTTIGLEQISTLGAVLSLTDVNFANNSEIIFTITYSV